MDRDFILAREAQLVYSNSAAAGFDPVGDTLDRWQGTLTYTTSQGRARFVFEIFLPEYYPNVPPVVTAPGFMDHPNVDEDGFVQLRILDNWRAEFHLYQVIIALKNLMSRVPPRPKGEAAKDAKTVRETMARLAPITPATPAQQESVETRVLRTELNSLSDQLQEKEEELSRLRAQQTVQASSPEFSRSTSLSERESLESERLAISELLSSLEDRYSRGDISIFEYSRLFRQYMKELYVVRKQLEYLS
ncbi:MAG: ubiquitin-conjugating enzyme E2 variant [Candidatus Heimdallarchaeota archaeon]